MAAGLKVGLFPFPARVLALEAALCDRALVVVGKGVRAARDLVAERVRELVERAARLVAKS